MVKDGGERMNLRFLYFVLQKNVKKMKPTNAAFCILRDGKIKMRRKEEIGVNRINPALIAIKKVYFFSSPC